MWIEIVASLEQNIGGVVTPFAGVWIEILQSGTIESGSIGHSLRGSVD